MFKPNLVSAFLWSQCTSSHVSQSTLWLPKISPHRQTASQVCSRCNLCQWANSLLKNISRLTVPDCINTFSLLCCLWISMSLRSPVIHTVLMSCNLLQCSSYFKWWVSLSPNGNISHSKHSMLDNVHIWLYYNAVLILNDGYHCHQMGILVTVSILC